MATLLVIHSSPKSSASVTRQLTNELVEKWLQANPTGLIIERDVGLNPPPHISETTINAFYTPEADRTETQKAALLLSDQLIAELRQADAVVIGTPMHNFSVTSGLKTWIDHVARVGETFQYSSNGPEGLLADRPVYVVGASGGDYRAHTPIAFLNHQDNYLKVVLNFVGIQDIRLIQAAGVARGDAALVEARAQMETLLTA